MTTRRADIDSCLAELGIGPASLLHRGLRRCPEATDLELVAVGDDGRQHLLVPAAVLAWCALRAAAADDGIELRVVSAFRSVERQAELVRRKLAAGRSLDDVLAVCAPPGFSEHHTGCAVDLATPGAPALEAEFERTAAFAWLRERAGDFGFRLSYPVGNPHGYLYEPWHWCFHGVPPDCRDGRSGILSTGKGSP